MFTTVYQLHFGKSLTYVIMVAQWRKGVAVFIQPCDVDSVNLEISWSVMAWGVSNSNFEIKKCLPPFHKIMLRHFKVVIFVHLLLNSKITLSSHRFCVSITHHCNVSCLIRPFQLGREPIVILVRFFPNPFLYLHRMIELAIIFVRGLVRSLDFRFHSTL